MRAKTEERFVFTKDKLKRGLEGLPVEDRLIVRRRSACSIDALAEGNSSVFTEDVAIHIFRSQPLPSLFWFAHQQLALRILIANRAAHLVNHDCQSGRRERKNLGIFSDRVLCIVLARSNNAARSCLKRSAFGVSDAGDRLSDKGNTKAPRVRG